MSMKNSNDTSWVRTNDLPICSTAHISIVASLNGKKRTQTGTRIAKYETAKMQGNFAGGCFPPVCLFVYCGLFAKFRKATVNFLMSLRVCVRMEQLTCRWTDFHEMGYLRILRKSVGETQVSLKSDKNNMKTSVQYVNDISLSCT